MLRVVRLLAVPVRPRIFPLCALRRFSTAGSAGDESMAAQMEVLFPVDSEYKNIAHEEAGQAVNDDVTSSSDSSTDDDSDIDEEEQAKYYRSDEKAPLWGALEGECGFKYEGPEPTRHGDWQFKGRCTDF